MDSRNTVLSWWVITTQKNDSVYDNIFIVYENTNVIHFYPFKRVKTASCNTDDSDCITNYSQNIKFITLKSELNKYTKPTYIEKR